MFFAIAVVLPLVIPPTTATAGQGPGSVRGVGPTLLAARAAEGAGDWQRASTRYLEAAVQSPLIADWLRLRAAALQPDSGFRQLLYTQITLPAARARILLTEARARVRQGDRIGAAFRYDSLGLFAEATRLRSPFATTAARREALVDGLLVMIHRRLETPQALSGLELLESMALAPTSRQLVAAARLAGEAGEHEMALALYRRAGRRAGREPLDLLRQGTALLETRRLQRAAAMLKQAAGAEGDPEVAAEAAYQLALIQARRDRPEAARDAIERVLSRFPWDTVVMPPALFLAGELAWERGDRVVARRYWKELSDRYPDAAVAPRAGFLAALLLYEDGQTAAAAGEWERVHLLDAGSDGAAAGFWAGRAWNEAGQTERAMLLWRSVVGRDSSSYYALASTRRLGIEPWRPTPAPDHFAAYADLDELVARLSLLRAYGIEDEIRWERNGLLAGPDSSAERYLAGADALRRAGERAGALALARRALAVGAPRDARTFRLLFPRHFGEDVETHAAARGLDPLLVSALIQQESAWETRARSRAGARGLMQIMPATGRRLARVLGVRRWEADALYQPDTNLQFGTWFLADVLRRFDGDLSRALAAYNAGPNRVTRWSRGRAATDPDLFIERITFRETRDYVRIIQRNRAIYQALYAGG